MHFTVRMKSKNTTFFFFNENYGNKGLTIRGPLTTTRGPLTDDQGDPGPLTNNHGALELLTDNQRAPEPLTDNQGALGLLTNDQVCRARGSVIQFFNNFFAKPVKNLRVLC